MSVAYRLRAGEPFAAEVRRHRAVHLGDWLYDDSTESDGVAAVVRAAARQQNAHFRRTPVARRSLSFVRLLRPYWRVLGVAFLAMLAAAATELAEPWPLKVIFDYVLGSRRPPRGSPMDRPSKPPRCS